MKALEMKAVMQAVQKNVKIWIETQGEGHVIGTDDFTSEMGEKFDDMLDFEIVKIQSITAKA